MSRLTHLPKTADTDAVLKLLDKDGAVIVDNFLHAERLQQINQEGITIVVITHEAEIAAMAQRVVRIRDGIITVSGDKG